MKVAWRLRRIALQQGVPLRSFAPIRFASTASAPTPEVEHVATPRFDRQQPPHIPSSSEAGPSNYASRTSSADTTETLTPLADFFTSHRPSSPIQEYLSSFRETDGHRLRRLNRYLFRPRYQRDEVLSTQIWRSYSRLSPSTRAHLNQKTLQNVLRAVVPASEHLRALIERTRQAHDVAGKAKVEVWTPGRYGDRILSILRDMDRAPPDADGNSGPRPSDYRFASLTLARLGQTHPCEAIALDMRKAGRKMDIRMIDSRLCALVEWLRYSPRKLLHPIRASRVIRVLWQIMGDMATYNLTPRNITMTLVIQAIYFAKRRVKAVDILGNLDTVLQDVCEKAYGMDMQYMTQSAGSRLMAPQVYALVDYWGRKGDVWKMISAYEVLVEHEAAEEGTMNLSGEGGVDVEERVPTLSGMMAQEAEDRGIMGWFGWPRAQQQDFATSTGEEVSQAMHGTGDHGATERDLPPHIQSSSEIPSIPTSTPDSAHRTYFDFFPSSPRPAPLTSTPTLSYPSTRLHTETISTLVRYTLLAGDAELLNHILSSALSSVKDIRYEWLRALQYRHNRTGGDPRHDEWFAIPGPRVALDHQWFWETDLFLRKMNAPIGVRRRFEGIMLEARDHMVYERDILESLRISESEPVALEEEGDETSDLRLPRPVVWSPIPFDPSSHLAILEKSQTKLESCIARTQSGMQTKIRRDARRAQRLEEIKEIQEEAERARLEVKAEKRRARSIDRVEEKEGGVVRMSSWQSEDSGVRMLGVA